MHRLPTARIDAPIDAPIDPQLSPMRVLIVKLSSLGDVVHAMPVVADIHRAFAQAQVDWVLEPAFAGLVQRMSGVHQVMCCPLRRWRGDWFLAEHRAERRALRMQMASTPYDAILDLQGLIKSAWIARMARGPRFGLANRTQGSSYEWPVRFLQNHSIPLPRHVHALTRSRLLAAQALGYALQEPLDFGLRLQGPPLTRPTVVLVHGTSRADKLWPETHWLALGQRLRAQGFALVLPQGNAAEAQRAHSLALALHQADDPQAVQVWPPMAIDEVAQAMAATQGVIGVDSGLSHIAVALDLPHVQIYNFDTAWRTGPLPQQLRQLAVGGDHVPPADEVWAAWLRVSGQGSQQEPQQGSQQGAQR